MALPHECALCGVGCDCALLERGHAAAELGVVGVARAPLEDHRRLGRVEEQQVAVRAVLREKWAATPAHGAVSEMACDAHNPGRARPDAGACGGWFATTRGLPD
eukprot:4372381-Prymnesium_polylepis.1